MIYPIVAYGDPVLKEVATDIDPKGDIDVKKLSADMFETMYQANGVGLAGPQIGLSKRIFVVDTGPMNEDEPEIPGFKRVFINAQILEESGEPWDYEEGCLSIPDVRGQVSRLPIVRIRYYDEDWQLREETLDGLPARVVQHEYDHIEGVLFTEHLSAFKRRLIKSKLANITKGLVQHDYRMRFPSERKKGMR
jgi:peptide deformylase